MESFYPHLHARCTQKRGELMHYYDIDTDESRDLPQILLPNEVADYLCIHINTVYKLIHQGGLPAFRVGKSWRIRREYLLGLFADIITGPSPM